MEFVFCKAGIEELPAVMKLMEEAKCGVPDSDWFEADEISVVKRHICEEGFILLAKQAGEQKKELAGFLIVRFPREQEDNLGEYLGLSREEMLRVAHLETAVVAPEFRGNQLQYRLFREAEEMLKNTEIQHIMATVHPENVFSFRNMEKLGMKKVVEVRKYGGKLRAVMWKKCEKSPSFLQFE